jgi:hypothetical protein
LAQKLDEEIQQWRERGIENSYPYLMIDARYEKVRRGGAVTSQGVLMVVGISAEGMREVLGVWVADSESEASWGEVFSDLSRRGLRGVRYVVSDDHQGVQSHRQTLSRCDVAAVPGAFCAQPLEPHGGARKGGCARLVESDYGSSDVGGGTQGAGRSSRGAGAPGTESGCGEGTHHEQATECVQMSADVRFRQDSSLRGAS